MVKEAKIRARRAQGLFTGQGVKHRMNIATATIVNNFRDALSSSQRSYTGGCRKRNDSTSNTIPHSAQPCQQ